MTAFPTSLPTPRLAAPLRGGPVLRWGVLAPGDIAKDFVHAMHTHTDQRAVAVASRSLDRARAFAQKNNILHAYDDHRAVIEHKDVDIVYVAAPHSEHKRLALMAIAAGKPVLIEKPIALTAADAREIRDAARAANVFAMEAMWTRYLPQTDVMVQLRDDGVLGDLRLVIADFGTRGNTDPEGRIYNPALGGGALLDLGIYPVWFSQLWLGKPQQVITSGSKTATGVDAQTAIVLSYGSGAQALLSTNLLAFSPARASLSGTAARIEVNPWMAVPAGFELVQPGKGDVRLQFVNDTPLQFRDGLAWEAAAVASHVAEGLKDSPLHPLDFAIATMETMDAIRRQLGTW
ncbi:MAG TPA: Gfo/Idh/MocA family oxidoreductase [Devosia sp.]|nr:Gfo/Idh/MocA family oxidoreductase [Devosia sp.]